jgi:hypothetical protein
MSPSLAPIPFDPFAVGHEFGVTAVNARLLQAGTPETRREHDYLKFQLEAAMQRAEDKGVPEGMPLRVRSLNGMTYLTFSSGLLGSGLIASGIDALSGRSVFQVRGSGLAAPVAASVLRAVRQCVMDMEPPMQVVTRPVGPAVYDPALYRPERLMVFRPRGLGRTDASRLARVDVSTCWVDSASWLLEALITGVEVAREVSDREYSAAVVHAFADDSVCPGY